MTEKVLFTGKTHTTSGRDGFARSTDGSPRHQAARAAPDRGKAFRRRLVGLLYRRNRACRLPKENTAAGPSVDRCRDRPDHGR